MDLYTFYTTFFVIFSTLIGIAIGSFLNVVIYRVPAGKTISKGHSMCMTCGHTLGAADLVPIFSWLFLRGKCRYCKAPIASRYMKIESLTGLVFFVVSLINKDCGLIFYYHSNVIIIMLTVYFLLFLFSAASTISAMMIYHDTQKAFSGPALFSVLASLIATIVLSVYNGFDHLSFIDIFTFVVVGVGLLAINWLFFHVFAKTYTINDFWLDLTFIGILNFSQYVWLDQNIITSSSYIVVYGLIRAISKNTKADKYCGIINAALIMCLIICRIFIK